MSTQPRAVSVALQKGGVGKTTIAINLAERLAARGNGVLLVDLDQQGNATEGVGLQDAYEADAHLGHVLDDAHPAEVEDVIRHAEWFDVLPSHENLDEVADTIRTTSFAEAWIRDEIVEPLLGPRYDQVVIDTPPALGALSDSSLIASGNVVIPLLMSEASVSGFESMIDQQFGPLRKQVGLDVLAVVPNQLEGDNEERRIIADLEDSPYGPKLPSFARSEHFERGDSPGPGIRKRIAFKRAWREGVPLAAYDGDNDMLPRLAELAAIVEGGGPDG